MSCDSLGSGLEPSQPAQLGQLARQIEQLLDTVEQRVGPAVFPVVEDLIAAIVELYGLGLGRLLEHASQLNADPAELNARLCEDAGLSGLLSLHGLHPLNLEERVLLAYDQACAAEGRGLSTTPGVLVIGSGRIALEFAVLPQELGDPVLRQRIAGAILARLPELVDVRIGAPRPAAPLIPLERLRQGSRRPLAGEGT